MNNIEIKQKELEAIVANIDSYLGKVPQKIFCEIWNKLNITEYLDIEYILTERPNIANLVYSCQKELKFYNENNGRNAEEMRDEELSMIEFIRESVAPFKRLVSIHVKGAYFIPEYLSLDKLHNVSYMLFEPMSSDAIIDMFVHHINKWEAKVKISVDAKLLDNNDHKDKLVYNYGSISYSNIKSYSTGQLTRLNPKGYTLSNNIVDNNKMLTNLYYALLIPSISEITWSDFDGKYFYEDVLIPSAVIPTLSFFGKDVRGNKEMMNEIRDVIRKNIKHYDSSLSRIKRIKIKFTQYIENIKFNNKLFALNTKVITFPNIIQMDIPISASDIEDWIEVFMNVPKFYSLELLELKQVEGKLERKKQEYQDAKAENESLGVAFHSHLNILRNINL